ncbi:uncharacterized protein BJ212DRAFT_1297821 [Suillus subaureus]|uniref:Uncharacterized protein n=1 Tax=Suillus subaureus TaxID=48587 RepID=A0A9P7JFR3_9AGAM|nr:uncharacterized protein BJ212DRAFT_1297821 [Suillus subaureus]KAG1820425.1 hypothetical protein BJ212DRAFT_1297821 [Suillus subaureus]
MCHVFQNDHEHNELYAEEPAKFMQAMSNCLTYLRNKYKKLCSRFLQTGVGIDPSQPNAGNNLLEQVISQFPWYEALNEIWKNNPAYAPKMFLSAPGADHLGGMIVLMSKCKCKERAIPPPEPEDELIEMYPAPTIDPFPAIYPSPTVYPSPAINPSPAVDTSPTINPSPTIHPSPAIHSSSTIHPPVITCPTINDNNDMGDDAPYVFKQDFNMNGQE